MQRTFVTTAHFFKAASSDVMETGILQMSNFVTRTQYIPSFYNAYDAESKKAT
jgi:hypothetical protein